MFSRQKLTKANFFADLKIEHQFDQANPGLDRVINRLICDRQAIQELAKVNF